MGCHTWVYALHTVQPTEEEFRIEIEKVLDKYLQESIDTLSGKFKDDEYEPKDPNDPFVIKECNERDLWILRVRKRYHAGLISLNTMINRFIHNIAYELLEGKEEYEQFHIIPNYRYHKGKLYKQDMSLLKPAFRSRNYPSVVHDNADDCIDFYLHNTKHRCWTYGPDHLRDQAPRGMMNKYWDSGDNKEVDDYVVESIKHVFTTYKDIIIDYG